MNAFPLELTPRSTAPRRLLGGVVVAVTVVLSIWLLVAAGLQRGQSSGAQAGPLPNAPSVIQAELSNSAPEAGTAPIPGPDIAPVRGSTVPR